MTSNLTEAQRRRMMKKLMLSLMVSLAVTSLFLQPVFAEEDWAQIKDKDGIVSFAKDIEGSKYRAFKAVTTIDLPTEVVGAVLRDVLEYPQWMENVSHTDLIKLYDETNSNLDLYLVMDFPWPTNDRDVVAAARTTTDPKTGIVTIKTTEIENESYPPKDGLVRLPKMTQFFYLEYLKKGQSRLTYSIHIEAGGNLPVMTVEPTLKGVPSKSLAKLREYAKSAKYASASKFSQENIETTKIIASLNMNKYYKDEALTAKVLANKDLFEKVVKSDYEPAVMDEVRNQI